VADQSSWNTTITNEELILANTIKIKNIIDEYGCITISRFGEKISHYAWLLVQHANHNIALQKQCLSLMILSNDVLLRDIAYLTDRIAILQGKKQLYGTQFDPNTLSGEYSPYPIKYSKTIDKRRAKMQLEPIAKYKEHMRKSIRK